MWYLKFHNRVRFYLSSQWYILLKSGRPDYSETALFSFYTMIFHAIFIWKINNFVHLRLFTITKVSHVLVMNFQSFLTPKKLSKENWSTKTTMVSYLKKSHCYCNSYLSSLEMKLSSSLSSNFP